jgi:hypothetical protein
MLKSASVVTALTFVMTAYGQVFSFTKDQMIAYTAPIPYEVLPMDGQRLSTNCLKE